MDNKDMRKNIDIELSIKPEKEELILAFEKELMLEDLSKFPIIKEGDISFQSAYIFDNGENIEVALYILNGLAIKTNFEKITFLLTTLEGKVIAQQTFDMEDVGVVPSNSARPCKIYFDKANLLVEKLPVDGCKLIVANGIKTINNVKVELENMPESVSTMELKKYEKYVYNLPLMRKGDVSISTYDINVLNDGSISIILFIRNARSEKIILETLPVTIFDGDGKKIANKIFDIQNVEVNPGKARLYNLMLIRQELNYDEFNVNNLTVSFTM